MKDCKLQFELETLLVGGLGVRLFALGVRLASQTLNQRDAGGAHPFSLEARSSALSVSAAALRAHLATYRIHSAVKNVIPKIAESCFKKSGADESILISTLQVGVAMTRKKNRRPLQH